MVSDHIKDIFLTIFLIKLSSWPSSPPSTLCDVAGCILSWCQLLCNLVMPALKGGGGLNLFAHALTWESTDGDVKMIR